MAANRIQKTKTVSMGSRAKLLADLEEKSSKNREIGNVPNEEHELMPAADDGYNPYDNPGTHKVMTDDRAFKTQRRDQPKRSDRR